MCIEKYLEKLSEDDKNTFCYLLDEMKIELNDIKIKSKESLKIKVDCTHLENVIKAFKIANNAIYFDGSSDYLVALYDVCKALKPDINVYNIGTEYLEE